MKTVLVVDDDPDIVNLVRLFLQSEGYNVEAAVNGGAIERARQARPAVVLLDISMPGMDGIEVARRLRADARTATIPLVLMSAAHRLRERAQEANVDLLMPKPFDLDDLLVGVRQLTGESNQP